MSKVFVLFAALSYLLRAECFEFYIARDLTSTKELPKSIWSRVEVYGIEDAQIENIKVRVSIPATLSYSVKFKTGCRKCNSSCSGEGEGIYVFIFFANDTKQILQVDLKKSVEGIFYSMPHKREKKMEAGQTETVEKENSVEITGHFPRSWLPTNPTKISATVRSTDGKYYNYYGIQNAALSIMDLMVVEEFNQLTL